MRSENVKMFEIRDEGTLIPVIAYKPIGDNEAEEWLVHRAGYGPKEDAELFVIITQLDGLKTQYSPHNWNGSRTMKVAHKFIQEEWPVLTSGQVIDVQCIIGETDEWKIPERMD